MSIGKTPPIPEDVVRLLGAAASALRSYQCGNSSPDLAEEMADTIMELLSSVAPGPSHDDSTNAPPDGPYKLDSRVFEMKLWAWVGEDELGSGKVGLKQAIVPAGHIPIVSCEQHKVDSDHVRVQMLRQAERYGKTISLVRFVFERIEDQVP